MPEYDYLCETCGPFSDIRPMAAYADPQPCPGCGDAAPRALLTTPALGLMDTGQRRAYATNERSANAPGLSSRTGRHPAGCGCCTGKSSPVQRNAVKGFPGKRPWMISH